MNENTLVATCGYSGDAHQIQLLMPYYVHHGCPVLVLSPEDAPIGPRDIGNPKGVLYKAIGNRAYIGILSLERQKRHLKALLEFPHQWFLINDSDSLVISPELPAEWYSDPLCVWSHEASDSMHTMPTGYPWPRYAAQPPYFMGRPALEKIVEWTEKIPFEDMQLPYIDFFMMRWTVTAGLPHKSFSNGCSCPTTNHPDGILHMKDQISKGGITLHAIKSREAIGAAHGARYNYLRSNGQFR